MLYALLFGDETTATRFHRVQRELLTLTLPRAKAEAFDFIPAATELSGAGMWRDPSGRGSWSPALAAEVAGPLAHTPARHVRESYFRDVAVAYQPVPSFWREFMSASHGSGPDDSDCAAMAGFDANS